VFASVTHYVTEMIAEGQKTLDETVVLRTETVKNIRVSCCIAITKCVQSQTNS